MKPRQLKFDDSRFTVTHSFGGSLLRRRKNRTARPLSFKHPLHLIVKSSQARGLWNFLRPRNRKIIDQTLAAFAHRYGVKILQTGNAGSHLHLLLKVPNRVCYLAFIRGFTGTMVRRICGTQALARRFFDARPFSRIVNGGRRSYRIAFDYVRLNELEGRGEIPPRKPRVQPPS